MNGKLHWKTVSDKLVSLLYTQKEKKTISSLFHYFSGVKVLFALPEIITLCIQGVANMNISAVISFEGS